MTRRLLAALGVLGLIAAVTAVSALAYGDRHRGAVPPPPAYPTSADQIQNIDQVRTAIKGYYGDTASSTPDPVDGHTTLHYASATGAYAKEVAGIERDAQRYLDRARHGNGHSHGTKAILLDVDDTSLNTYDYEIYSNFAYNPTTNAAFVNAAAFPAVFGMPQLVRDAQAHGYTVLFLTGRPETQRQGTVTNLTQVGFPSVPSDHLVLKDYTVDTWLSPCAPSCTTDQYKTLTRRHFEQDLGYDIVANFGDQYSDLNGGYADRTVKLPNPMYFLP